MNWAHRAVRVLAIVGALGIWVPFAALAGVGILAALSSPGLGEGDWSMLAIATVIVVAVPIAIVLALRVGGVVATLILTFVGLAVPLSWTPMMRPEYSEPLHLLTRLGVLFGAVTALGGLLMFERPARREHASDGQGRVS